MNIRLYDPDIEVNDIVYISEITLCLDEPENDSVTLSNEDIAITGLSFSSILSRMTRLADLIDQKNSLYDRAEAINGDGSIHMQRLDGQINVLKNRLSSAISSWYTDERGNLVFESTNGRNAMMLTGDGFMIANGRTREGDWNWRTFGTGEGFTADAITTGYMSADRIEAGTITANHLSSGVGASIDLSENSTLSMEVIRGKLFHTGDTAPDNPKDGDLWMDTSSPAPILKRYTKEEGSDTYVWAFMTSDPGEMSALHEAIANIQ